MLVTPVVLHRVVQVVTEGVEQPEVVEQEGYYRTRKRGIDIGDIIVETMSEDHERDFHQQCQRCGDGRKRDFLVDLAVVGQARLGIITDEDHGGNKIEYKMTQLLSKGEYLE